MKHYLEIIFPGLGTTYLPLSESQAAALSRCLNDWKGEVRLEVSSHQQISLVRKPE